MFRFANHRKMSVTSSVSCLSEPAPKMRSQDFLVFSPPHFNHLGSPLASDPTKVPYDGPGARRRFAREQNFLFLPLTAM